MDNQFGFKKNLSTEMCVFALKQYLTDYNNNNNTNMFVAFLDASKALQLRKSYYSVYKRIQLSCNSIIIQLYEYNIVFPSVLFTMWYNSLFV